jgi:hypothetical protein
MAANISHQQEIQRLIRQADSARSCLKAEYFEVRQRFDVRARLRQSLKFHAGGWLAGALASGAATGFLLRGGKRRRDAPAKQRGGIFMAAIGLILTALRPFAKVWLTDRVKTHLLGRANGYLTMKTGPVRTPANPVL